jgi:hypothetical protein
VQQVRAAGGQVLQQPAGIRAGVVDPGLRPGGVLAQPDRPTVAAAPAVINHAVQRVPGGTGELFQGCAHRLSDQLQAGQVPHGRQDMGGAGALGGALADQPGLLQPGQGQVKEPVRAPLPSAVNLNVDLDLVLCVLAQALTTAFRLRLPGNYATATTDTLQRRFLDTPARSSATPTASPSRSTAATTRHSPRGKPSYRQPVPWWEGRQLHFGFA